MRLPEPDISNVLPAASLVELPAPGPGRALFFLRPRRYV